MKWTVPGMMPEAEDDLTPGTEEYQYFMEALHDPGYREKLDHFLFLVSTDTITHFLPGDEYKYITRDGMYEIQMVSGKRTLSA